MLNIEKTIENGAAVFALGGRLDTTTAPELEKELKESLPGLTENLAWLNSLNEGADYTQAVELLTDFHSPVEDGPYAWDPDTEYTDFQWWLARSEGGGWELVSWGY